MESQKIEQTSGEKRRSPSCASPSHSWPNRLYTWYTSRAQVSSGYGLFEGLLRYDPAKRFTAAQALEHPWFTEEEPKPSMK